MIPLIRFAAASTFCAVLACVQSPSSDSEESPPDQRAAQPSGRVTRDTLAALEARARRIVNPNGCSSAASCRSAPVGAKACGGPRDFLVFCPLTTDTTALFSTLDELKRLEEQYNRQEGIVSDCMLMMAPELALEGGACVAKR